MSPTAISEPVAGAFDVTAAKAALKTNRPTHVANGSSGLNGQSHAQAAEFSSTIDPGVKGRPNLALYVTPDHRIYQKEVPYPSSCPPDSCVVHVRATGICGSEIHFWKAGRIGDVCVEHDLILGHESAGQILEVGSKVKHLKVGDRVSIEPGVSCLECDMCLRGRYNLCPDVVCVAISFSSADS